MYVGTSMQVSAMQSVQSLKPSQYVHAAHIDVQLLSLDQLLTAYV